jgi:hypothetical protein
MRMSSPSDDDLVEIEPDAAVPDAHLLALVVRVRRQGFSGEARVSVARADWMAFAQELTILESTGQGSARIEGASPGELSLTVRSLGNTGVGVEGALGLRSYDTEVLLTFSVLAFEPNQLVSLARGARSLVG